MSQANFDGGDLVGSNYVIIEVSEAGGIQNVYENGFPSQAGQIHSMDCQQYELEYQNFQAEIADYQVINQSSEFCCGPLENMNDNPFLQKTEHVDRNLVEMVVKFEDFGLALETNFPKENDIDDNNNVEEINNNTNEEIHLVERSQDNQFTCMMCNIESTVRGEAKAIITHMLEIHNVRLYICDVCGQDFRKRSKLNAHMDAHIAVEEGDFQCEVCNRIFSNLRLFRIHKRTHNPQNKPWECDKCKKRYNSKKLLDEHYNSHTGVRPYHCFTCEKNFATKYTFKAHEKTHETRERNFKCTQCEKAFLNQQNLNQHLRIHSGVKEFICHECFKEFATAHSLETHLITHTGIKPYECSICKKTFARKAEIMDHKRTHTGERPFKCKWEGCGKAFSQRSNLKSHKKATHLNEKPHKCTLCPGEFKRKRLLNYHIKARHTLERPYKCEECVADFVYPEHFKKHKLIHTGAKPHSCCVCGRQFSSRDNRNSHVYTHSKKKPYECIVCNCQFMRKPLLYRHMSEKNHWTHSIQLNQPQILAENGQYVTINSNGFIQFITEDTVLSTLQTIGTMEEEDSSNLFIGEDMLLDGNQNLVTLLPQGEVIDGDGNQHKIIIINGQQYQYADVPEEGNGEDDEGAGIVPDSNSYLISDFPTEVGCTYPKMEHNTV